MNKRFLGFICIIYSLIISYVWILDKLKNFLAPQMQLYLKISLIFLIIIAIILIVNGDEHYKFKTSDLVLLIPVLLIIVAGDGKLSVDFANNRLVGFKSTNKKSEQQIVNYDPYVPEIPIEDKKDDKDIKKDTNSKKSFSKIDINVVDQNYSDLSYYISFQQKAKKFIGQTIKVSGFVINSNINLPGNYYALGKYAVSCCVADASFTGFYIYSDKVKVNTWYEIEGVIESTIDKDGYEIRYIDVVNVKEIDEKNQNPYVYPCDSYDNGDCKEVKKYNLE